MLLVCERNCSIVRWLIGGLFDGLDVVEYVVGRCVREYGSSGVRVGG